MEACKKAFEEWLDSTREPTEAEELWVDSLKCDGAEKIAGIGFYAGYHAQDELIRDLVGALKELVCIVDIEHRNDDNHYAWAELPEARKALTKAKEAWYVQ